MIRQELRTPAFFVGGGSFCGPEGKEKIFGLDIPYHDDHKESNDKSKPEP